MNIVTVYLKYFRNRAHFKFIVKSKWTPILPSKGAKDLGETQMEIWSGLDPTYVQPFFENPN